MKVFQIVFLSLVGAGICFGCNSHPGKGHPEWAAAAAPIPVTNNLSDDFWESTGSSYPELTETQSEADSVSESSTEGDRPIRRVR